jgi:ribosomal protein S18 acetylase RimI-like enzyme
MTPATRPKFNSVPVLPIRKLAPVESTVVVRQARVADAARIALVQVRSWQEAYRGHMPQDYLDGLDPERRARGWTRLLTERDPARSGILIAEAADDLLGFVSYCKSRDDDVDPVVVGEVEAIYLMPSAWGGGIGRRLMTGAAGGLAAAGFTQATLWVLEANDRARRFYAAVGWTADGTTKQVDSLGFPIIEVRYRRSLPAVETTGR